MTFTLSDRKHLEIMAKLSNTAPPKSSLPLATQDEINAVPSFTEKLLTLTSKLRSSGFSTYASSLESKFLTLKKAAAQDSDLLYRAHTETGEDLIEFAHPDGDTEMAPASDHLGDVETQLSQHKKILEVIQKDPSKKKVSKAQAAQPIARPVDPQVSLADIANKFKVFAEYIRSHFLNEFTTDNTDPNRDQYYKMAVLYFQLGNKVFEALLAGRSVEQKPVSLVLNVIKGALNNTAAQNEKFNSLDDIDRFTNKILSWLEDNNPIKKAELIGMVKKALIEKTALLPWVIYQIWIRTRRKNVGIIRNSKILEEELRTVLQHEVVSKSKGNTRLVSNSITLLNTVPVEVGKFNDAGESHSAKLKAAQDYNGFLGKFKEELTTLYNKMDSLEKDLVGSGRHDPGGIPSSVDQWGNFILHRGLYTSPFTDAMKAIEGLRLAISDVEKELALTLENIEQSDDMIPKSPGAAPGNSGDPSDPTNKKIMLLQKKNAEISKLNAWRQLINGQAGNKLNEAQKNAVSTWIDKQLEAIKASDEMKIDGLIAENNGTEQQLKKLQVL